MPKRTTRRYVKSSRAQQEAETRDRILEAVTALHGEIGPLRTTIKAIAERAGVQRLTVYRHFPGQRQIIVACSARWSERQPPPDPGSITPSEPSRARTRALLLALYGYYRQGATTLEKIFADAPHMPELDAELAPFRDSTDALVAEMARAWRSRSSRRHATLLHAAQFATWQSLAQLTGSDAAAVDLVLRWCDGTSAP